MSKFNVQLIIDDKNVSNSIIDVTSQVIDSSNYGNIIAYFIVIVFLFIASLFWSSYAQKKIKEDPIWEEENIQYHSLQYGKIIIFMGFIIITMILGMLTFMDVSLFSKSTKSISVFAFFLSMILISIRIIDMESGKFEKAKEMVNSRRGLYTLLNTIVNIEVETLEKSSPEKIKELSLQYISILEVDKFASTVREDSQKVYSLLLLQFIKASLRGDTQDIIDAQNLIKKLFETKSFLILKVTV